MKACVFTLGCKLNEVESASLMQGLEELGFETSDELCYADYYVLNTCAVTAEAEKKSRQAVARMRKFNPNAPVAVCGCASEKNAQAFQKKEGVLFVTGAQKKERVLAYFKNILNAENAEEAPCLPYPKRTKTRAFLRIQDGCNRFCSYCIIPYLRGRTRSRSAQDILNEALLSGAKEIVLTGIDISSYQCEEGGLAELLLLLKNVPARIRFGSLEASAITPQFLNAIKEAGNVMPHFHLSLQSGSSRVLKAMNRRYTREEYLEKCNLIYHAFAGASITTDIIVGYPTETEEDFSASLSIVEEAGFAHVHAFPFSPREGTVAAKLSDLPAAVKKERMARLQAVAYAQEERYLHKFIGQEVTVLFEDDGGYSENYLRVYAAGSKEGELKKVKLLARMRDGLKGEIIK